MGVSFDLSPERGLVLELPPSLREREEKALFACESADYDIGLAFQ
jgi:hypothetical protein